MILSGDPMEVLLIEDSNVDVMVIREALDKTGYPIRIHVMQSAEQAMGFLLKSGEQKNAPTPHLIFMDINLPGLSGLDFLSQIKNHGELKKIPVIIMSTSVEEKDVLRAYNSQAACYLNKSFDFHELCEMMKTLFDFWYQFVSFPPMK